MHNYQIAIKTQEIVWNRFLIILVAILVACSNPTQPVFQPIEMHVTPQMPSPTSMPKMDPTLTPTILPIPTAFATAPLPGEAAIIPILMYHHLGVLPKDATELQLTWTVLPDNFQTQMNWLTQHAYHTISMAQLINHFNKRQPLPSKPTVISFDDGWEEQYMVAFPVLKKLGFIGTFFVYTNPIGHSQYLSWSQLQEMTAAGMDIQTHTLSHPHLRNLDKDAAEKEITESKAILEKHLGKPIVAISYPYGEYNTAVIDMVKRAGLEAAVTLASGYRQRADDLFTLHRIRVSYNDSLEEFVKQMPQ